MAPGVPEGHHRVCRRTGQRPSPVFGRPGLTGGLLVGRGGVLGSGVAVPVGEMVGSPVGEVVGSAPLPTSPVMASVTP